MVSGVRKAFACSIILSAAASAHAFADDGHSHSLAPDNHGLYFDGINVGEEIAERWIGTDSNVWRFVGTWEAAAVYQGIYDLYLYYPQLGGPVFDLNPRIVIRKNYHKRVRSAFYGAAVGRMVEISLSERQYDCLDRSVVRRYFSLEIDNSFVTYKYDFTKDYRFYDDSYVPGITGFSKETETWYRPDSEHQALWEIVCDLDNYDLAPPPRRIR